MVRAKDAQKEGVKAELVMVVEIFVTGGRTVNVLGVKST